MPLPIFSERLKDLMLIEGVSQHKLSSAANVQRKSVSNWLRGINYPRYDALIRVADYFRISTDYLIGINNTAELEKTQQTPHFTRCSTESNLSFVNEKATRISPYIAYIISNCTAKINEYTP